MYFITNGAEATDAVFDENDKTVAVICTLSAWEQILLLSRMFTLDYFERLCFHRSLNGFHLMSTFNGWIVAMENLTRLEVTDSPGFGIEMIGQFLRAVSKSRIQYLNVSGMALGVEGARLLCKAVKESGRIHTVRADRNQMQTGVRQVLELGLRRVTVGENDVHRLWWPKYFNGISPKVRRLGLENSRIGELGFHALSRYIAHSRLVELDLGHNELKMASIKSLCLGLVDHAHLSMLHLNNCRLQNGGVKLIAAMLPLNHSLQQLYMHGNPSIDETGQLYLIKALQSNFTLWYLEIDVLFDVKCDHFPPALVKESRLNVNPAEPVTAHLTGLVCANQDLDLATQFWQPRLHRYYPEKMRQRVDILVQLLSPILPHELILHILSFWKGIQFT